METGIVELEPVKYDKIHKMELTVVFTNIIHRVS